jgi:hypothetical protein
MKKLIAIALLALTASGCAYSPVSGMITVVNWDGSIGDQNVRSIKTGKACAHSILGIVAVGDASIRKAKQNGGITKVALVDHQTTNVLYIYGGYCTIVTGE